MSENNGYGKSTTSTAYTETIGPGKLTVEKLLETQKIFRTDRIRSLAEVLRGLKVIPSSLIGKSEIIVMVGTQLYEDLKEQVEKEAPKDE